MASDLPWTSYLGTSNQPVPWGKTVRAPYHYKLGEGLLAQEAVTKIADINLFLEKLSKLAGSHPSVILGIGPTAANFGEGKEGVDTYRALIRRDGGKSWKKRVTEAASVVHLALGSEGHIYWQIGNEVNALTGFSKLDDPSKKFSTRGEKSDIGPYVEWVLAPIAEALIEARSAMPATSARLSIMLGSIASARNPKNTQWLEALLDYRIKGTYAPTLRGKAVHEVVDVAALHYLVSRADTDWEARLTGVYNRWVRSGRLDALFLTEEVGKRYAEAGLGGSAAMKVLGRYLYWSAREKVDPEKSRMLPWILWRVKDENNVDQMMTRVYRFLGDTALDVTAQRVGRLEAYRLATKDGSKVLGIVFNTQKGAASIERVPLSAGRAAVPRCTVLAPRSVADVSCTNGADGTIKLGKSIKLLDDDVLLIQVL